jgi:hypothetical protein
MNALTRAALILVAACLTGALLWSASQFDTQSTGGYWAAMGVIAVAGLLFGLSQTRSGEGRPAALLVLLPIVVVAVWTIVVAQPDPNTYRNHLRAWDEHLGIGGAVHAISLWNGVIAFGAGLALGLVIEPRRVVSRRRKDARDAAAASAPASTRSTVPLPEPLGSEADEPTVVQPEEQQEQQPLVPG